MFVYSNKVEPVPLSVQEISGSRFYITPQGNKYPSVTTVLGAKEKPWLDDWRKSLGAEKADKETKRGASRGTAVHSMIEKYLANDTNPTKGHDVDHINEFYSIRTRLNPINNIRAQELALYSDTLKVAGRTDCIAEYNGILSVVDFKTSTNNKYHTMIEDYYLQSTAYAVMYNELYDQWIDDIVIVISIEKGAGVPLIFKQKVDPYIKPLIKRINKYHTEHNNGPNSNTTTRTTS